MGLFPNAAYLHHSGEYRTVRGDVPLKAGLEKSYKTPGFFFTQPSGVFCFFYIFAQKREFLGFFQFQEYF